MEGGRGGLGAVVVDGGADLEAETTSRVFVVGGINVVVVAPPPKPLPPALAGLAGAPTMRACISTRGIVLSLRPPLTARARVRRKKRSDAKKKVA